MSSNYTPTAETLAGGSHNTAEIKPENTQNTQINPGTLATPKEKVSWKVKWVPRLRLSVALFLPIFLETLDYTVVATAQTNIALQFNRLDLQSYIGTVYVLTGTVFLPIFASLADVYGRYFSMQLSVALFIIGSAISTGANDMVVLLVGRGIAGIGAAGLMSVVRILLSDSESLEDNNFQAGMLTVLYAIGYTVGPVLGGVLYGANWRWVFAINLPCCVLGMILIWVLLKGRVKGSQPPRRLANLPPEIAEELRSSQNERTSWLTKLLRLDFIGAALFIVSGITLLLALNWGSTEAWDEPKVIACFVVGGVTMIAFVSYEWLIEHSADHLLAQYEEKIEYDSGEPVEKHKGKGGYRQRFARFAPKWTKTTDAMIPINMFRDYDIVIINFATLTSGMVMLGIFYFVAIFYVIVDGRNPTDAGVQLLYFAPGIGLGVIISIRLVNYYRQPKPAIKLASILIPVALGLLSDALYHGNQARIAGFMLMTGAGVGLGFGPLSIHARFRQPEDRVAIVVATNLFFRTAGGTIGLAQLAAVLNTRVRDYITNLVSSGQLGFSDAGNIGSRLGHLDAVGNLNEFPPEVQQLIKDAFTDGIRWAFISLVPWTGLAAITVFFLRDIPEERLAKERRELPAQSTDLEAPDNPTQGQTQPQIQTPSQMNINNHNSNRASETQV